MSPDSFLLFVITMQPSFYPPFLPDAGTIMLISPCRWAEESYIDSYKAYLEGRGYRVKVAEQCYQKDGIFAGTDAARAEALVNAFKDPSVNAVFCVRGGAGANLILDLIDFDVIKNNPKPFVGFSDITILLNAITQKTGMITYHGPMAGFFVSKEIDRPTEAGLFNLITCQAPYPSIPLVDSEILRAGQAKGYLVGGNLGLLRAALSTSYEWDSDGVILFFEDVSEPLYKIELMLAQLKQARKLDHVKAVLIGEMVDVIDWKEDLDPEEHMVYGRKLEEFVLKYLPPDVPVANKVPCGHGQRLLTFPIGAEVELSLTSERCEMMVSA